MTYTMPHKRPSSSPRNNRGVALIISLILLVVMTIFGLAGVRLISSEERMVAQTYDRALAFQAAEAELRTAEIAIETAGQPSPAAGTACALLGTGVTLMTCGAPAPTDTPRWTDSAFDGWTTGTAVAVTSGGSNITLTPEYFVEYLGDTFPCGFDPVTSSDTCKRYRVTTRVRPSGGRAAVTLQSIYATS
jgi:type IV pilus assembly protein PilX